MQREFTRQNTVCIHFNNLNISAVVNFWNICVVPAYKFPASHSCLSHKMVSKALRVDILFAQTILNWGNYFTVQRAFLSYRPEGKRMRLFHDIWWRQHACRFLGENTVIGSHVELQKAPKKLILGDRPYSVTSRQNSNKYTLLRYCYHT